MGIGLNTIKASKGAKKARKRVGRGNASGHGTYSTRGQKGQKARAGVSGLKRLGFRDTLRSIPKKRGFKSPHPKYEVVNLGDINKKFKSGEKVNPDTLRKKGLIGKIVKRRGIKVLSFGDLTNKLIFENLNFSKGALEKIEKSGSQVIGKK
jgi:large subunit ribosomal protein L15